MYDADLDHCTSCKYKHRDICPSCNRDETYSLLKKECYSCGYNALDLKSPKK